MSTLTHYELEMEKSAQKHFGNSLTTLVFRGQSDESWLLDSSAERRLKKSHREFNTDALLTYLREDLIDPAKKEGYGHQNGKELSDLELLAELRHHQAATCLIDFTRNFHIALWFACVPNNNKDGKVFIVKSGDPNLFEDITSGRSKDPIEKIFSINEKDGAPLQKKVLYWQPPTQNNRIIVQHSCFIFSSEKIPAGTYTEITIKKKDKPNIELALKLYYGLDNKSVYRDFVGFAFANNQDQLLHGTSDSAKISTYLQANEMTKQGEYKEAIKAYDRAIELDRGFINAYYNRGVAKIQLKEPQEAIEDFNKAIELKSDEAQFYFSRGFAKAESGKHEEAIEDFSKAIELKPDDAYAYFNQGLAKAKSGKYEEAIEDLNKGIELKPDDAHAYFNRGIAKARSGKREEAIEDFSKGIELKPDDARAYFSRGLAKARSGKREEAIEDFSKGIELKPDEARAYFSRGFAKARSGKYEEAIEDFNKAIELKPDDAQFYFNRGLEKARSGKYEEAIEDFNKAIELKPDDAQFYFNRGLEKARSGKYEEAIEDFNKATELKPDDAEFYFNRGKSHKELGNTEQSAEDIAKAEKLKRGYDV